MEISFLNNIKKYSSVNDRTGIANVMNEALREAEKFKNLQFYNFFLFLIQYTIFHQTI